jgi:hypothetical protein
MIFRVTDLPIDSSVRPEGVGAVFPDDNIEISKL